MVISYESVVSFSLILAATPLSLTSLMECLIVLTAIRGSLTLIDLGCFFLARFCLAVSFWQLVQQRRHFLLASLMEPPHRFDWQQLVPEQPVARPFPHWLACPAFVPRHLQSGERSNAG